MSRLAKCLLNGALLAMAVARTSSAGAEASEDPTLAPFHVQAALPSRIEPAADPAGSTRQVLHVELRATDRKVANGQRSEIVVPGEGTTNGVRWYALSTYVPASWVPTPLPVLLAQVHTAHMSVPVSPPLAVVVRGEALYLALRSDMRRHAGEPLTQAALHTQRIDIGRLPRDRWLCFVVHIDATRPPGQGSLAVWLGRDPLVATGPGANAYLTRAGNYPKVGLYAPGGVGAARREVFVDAIRIGDEQSSLDSMLAQTPCGAPP